MAAALSSYGAFLQNNSATTILYDQPNNQFIEYFPSGATCYYKNQGEPPPTGYTNTIKAVTRPDNVFTNLLITNKKKRSFNTLLHSIASALARAPK